MKGREKIFTLILSGIFILSLITDWYRLLVILLVVVLLVKIVDSLGTGIVLRELMAIHGVFVCLLMPLIGYLYYDQNHHLARLWVKYMTIPEDVYFNFCLPAMAGFTVALCWPMIKKREKDGGEDLKSIIEESRVILKRMPKTGIYFMVFGTLSSLITPLLPVVVQFAFGLFFFASFSGFLYVYFTPYFKMKVWILAFFAIFIFLNALQSGMFTIVAYMGLTMISFFFVGKKIAFWKKISVLLFCGFFIVTLQSVKLAYRQYTWRGDYEGSKITLFFNLAQDQFGSSSEKNISDAFFPIYTRGNQGYNVAMVMNRFPKYKDFDGGGNLFTNLLSSFVPRVFWTDKPEAGGKFNMRFYTGYIIENWSTNVGPLGEAYGSFGVIGGILFMMALGGVIRWSYRLTFRVAHKVPLMLYWVPLIFYQITYSAESDTLQVLNSLIKSGLFVWVLYRFRSEWFGVIKKPFAKSQTNYSAISHVNAQPSITD